MLKKHLNIYIKKNKRERFKIFMYTVAENLDNYVFFLKDCLEYHCSCIGLFDKVYDRNYCNEDLSKSLDNIKGEYTTSSMIMFDDRPNNIDKKEGFIYGVEPFISAKSDKYRIIY